MNDLDIMWRSFFVGEKHQILSQMFAKIFNDFLKKSLEVKIVLDNDYNKRLLLKVDKDDLSTTTKLADTYFETKFLNKNDIKIKCNLGSALKKYHNEVLVKLSARELEKLKLDIHNFSQFETISKILLQARNINAHWQVPVNDVGHGSLVSGAILRFLELFEFNDFKTEQVEQIRALATQILIRISSTYSNEEFENEEYEDDEINNESSVFESENIVIGVNDNNNNDETNSSTDQNTEVDEELELPNINFTPQKTKEQKRQLLIRLGVDLLKDKDLEEFSIKRPNFILSRQCIKEFLQTNARSQTDLLNCPNMVILLSRFSEQTEKQIELYCNKILEILNN